MAGAPCTQAGWGLAKDTYFLFIKDIGKDIAFFKIKHPSL